MFEPQAGDFEVVPTGGAGGFWIRVGQTLNGDSESQYQHARLYLGNKKIVEAEPGPGGARIADWDPKDSGFWSTGIISLTGEQRAKIVLAGLNYVGTRYSAADYFAMAAKRLHLGPLIPGLRNYVQTSKHMICSQLVDRCYLDAGVQLFDDKRWDGYVTPADLANLLLRKIVESQEKQAV